MAVKLWLQDRWAGLFPALQALTVAQEAEIERLCTEEIEYWRSRGISQGALKGPMTATRKEIKSWPLTEANSYVNPRTRQKEHIALKYMNFSTEEWAAINAPSQARFEERLEDIKFIENPDAVVAKAAALLASPHWYEIAAGLAVVCGRRYEELISVGQLFPKTAYSLNFKGQLKRKDQTLPPYEIPTLVEAAAVLDAWRRLRDLGAGADGRLVSEAAEKHFSSLVPGRAGGDLYTHLFRAVYGCIAVFYYAPPEVLALRYLATIYGHYWVLESSGKQQHDYTATLHYSDYAIGDAAIAAAAGKRQGIKLGVPGVEVLEVFKERPVTPTKKRGSKMAKTEVKTEKASQTGYSMLKPRQATKDRIDQIIVECNLTSSSLHDEALTLLIDEHYQLQQLTALGVDLAAVVALLVDAAKDNEKPVDYLAGLLEQKRAFKQSYEKRHAGKDYSSMSLEELRNTKTTEAATERFRRAVAAIMAYNAAAAVPEQRWYINASVVTDLVGGKPSIASVYLDEQKEAIEAHHKQYNLTAAYNRRPVKITARLRVPDRPGETAYELVEA
jgi:hypothetical protein